MSGITVDEKQIKDDFMCMRLTNDNYLVVCQGQSVKAKITKASHQRQPLLKRLIRALQAAFRVLG